MQEATPQLTDAGESRLTLKLAGLGGLALIAAARLLWLRFGSEVFTAALQAAWTCF